jgi:flagellar assembly protein FliH
LSSILKSSNILLNRNNKYILEKDKSLLRPHTDKPSEVLLRDKLEYARKKLESTKKEADEVLRKARQQSELILSRANEEADKIKKQAWQEGLREGQSKANEELQAKTQKLLSEIETIKYQIEKDKETFYAQSQEEMLTLALDIAKKIIGDKMEEDDKTFARIARNVLKKVKNPSKITLRVSKDDYDDLLKAKDLLYTAVDEIDELDILKDESLKKGSCLVDTGNGVLDGGIDTQFELLQAAFDTVTVNKTEKLFVQ